MSRLRYGVSYGVHVPCKDCKDRVPECHSTCARYKAYSDELSVRRKRAEYIREQGDYDAHKYATAARRQALYSKRHGGKKK